MWQVKQEICAGGLLLMLGACASLPGLEAGAKIPASTEQVVLLPLDQLNAEANTATAESGTASGLAARAARLRARAAAAR